MEHRNQFGARSPFSSERSLSPNSAAHDQRVVPLHGQAGEATQQEGAPNSFNAALARKVRNIQRARINRGHLMPPELFADPAWDMLLELFVSSLAQTRVSVSGLSSASGVPSSTALRWLATLEEHELVVRRDDPLDARRVFVMLSAYGLRVMQEYFNSLPTELHPL